MTKVLVIGGTGYLGSLVCATLLTRTADHVTLAARPGHEQDDIVARLRMEMTAAGDGDGATLERLRIVRLPSPGDTRGFSSLFRENRIEEVVNCAGAVNYTDVQKLKASNVDLVTDLLAASKEARIFRFVHVSTAFAQGYAQGAAVEGLFPEPESDPTQYTRFKRVSERLIAESGVPFLMLRPSIVIGDSRDSHYFGPAYGVYQLWWSFAKVLMDRYRREMHFVASDNPVPLLHQDAFAETLLAARKHLPANSFVNVVSDSDGLPTADDLWRLWCNNVSRPHQLFGHKTLSEVPLETIDPPYRAFLKFTSVNRDIADHPWRFETKNRDLLVSKGMRFPQATIESVHKCQNRFVAQSETVRAYYEKYSHLFPGAPPEPRGRELAESGAGGARWLL